MQLWGPLHHGDETSQDQKYNSEAGEMGPWLTFLSSIKEC